MNKQDVILVTGGTGMVGGGLARQLRELGYHNVLTPTRQEMNLLDRAAVCDYFAAHRPKFVFLIAAKVGGIVANQSDQVGFLSENMQIALHGLAACHEFRVQKALLLGSSCIYPRECPQPIREEYLLTGPFEPTNEGYALAKTAALKLAGYYHQQFGLTTVCPMPCNIYGTGDNFDLRNSHVLSALVRRFCDAVDSHAESVTLWGSGAPTREFLHVDDVVQGMLLLMEKMESPEVINLGAGKEIAIRDLAAMIAEATGFRGRIQWDTSRPDGMPRKCLDTRRIRALGFEPSVDLRSGVRRTIHEYRQRTIRRAA